MTQRRQEQPGSVCCGHSRAEIAFIRYVLPYRTRSCERRRHQRRRPDPVPADDRRAARRRRPMHGLRFVPERHADRVRRRTGESPGHAGRRAAGRCRRPRRPPLRRTGGKALGPLPRRGGDRPKADLRHQCRQTLQMGAARAAAHSQQTGRGRNRGLLSLARGRDQRRQAANRRGARSDRGAGPVRKGFSGDPRPRPARALCAGALRARDSASLGIAARPGRGDPPPRDRALYRGFAPGRGDFNDADGERR